MDKCINTYFLFGNEIKSCSEFENYNRKVGKSLYEVIRISDGIPIFLMEHLQRLENSAKIMKYTLCISRDEIINAILSLIDKNNVNEGNIKLVINYISKDENTENNEDLKEVFLAYLIPYSYPSKEQYLQGVKTITYHGERNNPNAKVIDNDFRDKVNIEINSKNAYEAILIDHCGFITEGSRSNIFMVCGNMVYTSMAENVLPGITRQVIIKICKDLNIEFQQRNIHESEIQKLTALFISGTSPMVLPINAVDEFSFNSSKDSIINSIMKEFQAKVSNNKKDFVKYIETRTINK
jgi:branched-chain amino acid aminotransferase